MLANLAERYQVPRNDFLAFFEKLGCESIAALTFVAEGSRLTDFKPSYAPLENSVVEQLREDAARAVTEMTVSCGFLSRERTRGGLVLA